jgi:acyl-CoA synthetase (AMP-forming)/AMP-acid ligase II
MNGGPAPTPRYETLQEGLQGAAATQLGLTFIDAREQETRLPYAELHERARAMAGKLAALGVAPGDRVALVLPTGLGFMDAFFGALYAGAVPVPLYPPVRLGRMDEYHQRTAAMLTAVGARLLISDARIRRLLGQAVERARPALGLKTVEELAGVSGSPLQHANQGTDLAVIQFSSGTTVDPKPVALSHRNLLANLATIGGFIDQQPGPHAGVTWLPLYHDMGLIGCLLEAIYHPGALALIPPELFLARPALWLRALSRHHGTVSPAPNFAYGLCLKRVRDEELDGVDLSGWHFALNGAEPVSPAVLERFAARFARWGFKAEALTPVYGLSEASLAVTFSAGSARYTTAKLDAEKLAREGVAAPGDREVVSVGKPLPGVSVEVRDVDGGAMPDGQVGRVCVQSPAVMAGYFGRPDATAKAVQDGWLDTGDLGFIQAGELFLCGRAKELVILRGANHAPQEFEECLDGVAGVRAGCAVAFGYVPEGEDGEALGLLVETEGDVPNLAETLRGLVAERTGVRPHVVVLLAPGTLPRTSSGKLRRSEAAALWQSGGLTAPRSGLLGVGVELVKSELAYLKARLGT